MHIKTALKNIESFAELESIIKKTQTGLSFFGSPYITVKGCEGKLAIDALAAKVLELVRKNPDFNEVERQRGKAIVKPINNIYKLSDELVKKANYITKLFTKLRSIYNLISSGYLRSCSKTRWHWRDCDLYIITSRPDDGAYYKVFQYYTENQYKKVFKEIPYSADEKLHGLRDLYIEPPQDVYNKKDSFK